MRRLIFLTLAAACSDTSSSSTSTDEIPIGSLIARSGDLSGTGEDNNNAALLAVEEINNSGGVLGRRIKLVPEDDKTTVDGAVAGYTSLLNQGVVAVIGPSSSAQVVKLAELIGANKTLTIGRTSTSPILSTIDDGDFFFRVAPSDQFQAKVLGRLILGSGVKKVCLVNREDTYGTRLADEITKELAGALPITPARYNPSQSDLSGVLDACAPLLCSSGADGGAPDPQCSPKEVGLVMVTYVTDGKAILSAAPEWTATKQQFFFTDGARDNELLRLGLSPDTLQGARGTIPSGPDPASPEGERLAAFGAAHQQRFGAPRPAYAQNAYDAAYAIAAAIEIAGSTDRVRIRDAFRSISTPGGTPVSVGKWAEILAAIRRKEPIDLRGASGELDFDENGDVKPPYYYRVWRIDDGKSVDDDNAYQKVTE